MTDLRAGATRLLLPTLGTPEERKGRFLEAVRKAAAGEFEILGELGRRPEGGIAYLARDLAQSRLVALRFELTPGSQHDYVLDVLQELDASLPASGLGCPGCGKPLRGWGRYCPGCGYDLSGSSGSDLTAAGTKALEKARALVGDGYEILGEMKRAEGGGRIYFAREEGKDTIVGFRIRQEEGKRGKKVAMDRTAVIPSLGEESGGGEGAGADRRAGSGAHAPARGTRPRGTPPGSTPPGGTAAPVQRPETRPSGRFPWPLALLVIALTLIVGVAVGLLLG
jgi:hypothetical protein